jgi:hypothetical protein
MSENCQSTSPTSIPVKNHWKTVSIEEKLNVISWLEKGEQIVDMLHNVTFAYGTVHTIGDNADRIRYNAKSGTEVFV